jgi:hypothetical protein
VLGSALPDWQDDVVATVHRVLETHET